MEGRLATFGIIAKIAFRNLFASRLKTAIVGGIILGGALLVVVVGSFVDSIVAGMRRSIVGSVPATSRCTRRSRRIRWR